MKSNIFHLLIALLSSTYIFSQPDSLACEQTIPLLNNINIPAYQFSGLAKWRDKILLIPQRTEGDTKFHIIAVDTVSIDSVINRRKQYAASYSEVYFDESWSSILKTIKIKAKIANADHSAYGGFEGAVVVPGTDIIYVTVETDSITCFVVKGMIIQKQGQWYITFNEKEIMTIYKPDNHFNNAGYESIAYWPAQNKLLAVYENNRLANTATAYMFNTDLKDSVPYQFTKPLYFRLTDIAHVNDSVFYGINYYYKDKNPKNDCDGAFSKHNTKMSEYCYYVRNDLDSAIKQMGNNDPFKTSYSAIIQLTIMPHNKIGWKKVKTISYLPDNWEGIIAYKDGILAIIDGMPGQNPCRLSYFRIK